MEPATFIDRRGVVPADDPVDESTDRLPDRDGVLAGLETLKPIPSNDIDDETIREDCVKKQRRARLQHGRNERHGVRGRVSRPLRAIEQNAPARPVGGVESALVVTSCIEQVRKGRIGGVRLPEKRIAE